MTTRTREVGQGFHPTRLRKDGVDITLDQWHLHPGDQLPAFMERAIRENDYVLIVCTPFYAGRSNRRIGGVGYEGDIMTGEVFTTRNERKFIPIYRSGADWKSAAPTWLGGKYRIDLRGQPYSEMHSIQDLFHTLHGTRPVAAPLSRTLETPRSHADSRPRMNSRGNPFTFWEWLSTRSPHPGTTVHAAAPFTESRSSSRAVLLVCGARISLRPGTIHPASA